MAIELGSTAASLGSALGQGLAQPIQEGLQLLAQKRLMDLQQRQQTAAQEAERQRYASGLAPMVGGETARFLSNLAPEERKNVFQNIGALTRLQGMQGMGMQPTGMQSLAMQPGLQQEARPTTEEDIRRSLYEPGAAPLGVQGFMPEQQAGRPAVAPGQPAMMPERAKLLQDLFTSPHEKREQEKLELKKQQLSQQERAAQFKVSAPIRKEIAEEAKTARSTLRDLGRMEELSSSGKLDTPGYVEFLQRVGLDIPALMQNPESEEFQKIAAGFMRDARKYFGARVSNFEIEQFLKTIPTLSQSPEGRKRVMANLKYVHGSALARAETAREIMAENRGIPPYDLQEQVEERLDKKLDALADKFKKDLEKPVPPGQNKLITALEAIAGSTLSAPAKLISKVGGLAGTLLGA